jgi:hypothetical protein
MYPVSLQDHHNQRTMTTTRKDFELLTPSRAAVQLGVARNTVMHRIATKRYTSEKVGGVTFVVVDDAFSADCIAAALKSAA